MTRRRLRDAIRAQQGFTLIELMVTAAMGVVVLSGALAALTVLSRDSQTMTRRNGAQDQARTAVDRVVRQLRSVAGASTAPTLLERATSYDLVLDTVGTPTGSNTEGIQRVRYCIPADPAPGAASTEALIAQTQTWSTASPPTLPTSTACPDTSGSWTATTILIPGVTNRYAGRTDRPAFSFNGNATAPSDLSTISTVGLDLFVNPTPGVAAAESELRSSASLRNEQIAPVAAFTSTAVGGGAIILNAGPSYSPAGNSLSYAWSCSSPALSASGSTYNWQPGAGTYTVTLKVTDQAGLSASTTKTVTVS